jgi:thiamine biosynthesis lipoprotein ApbE
MKGTISLSTSGDAIRDLEDSKKALEHQCVGASGETLVKLLTSIQHIVDEVDALEASLLATAAYVPQTDQFKATTTDARDFVADLSSIKTAFAAVGTVVQVIDKLLAYIK